MKTTRMLYVTAPDLHTARRIGEALVRDRLVACVNLLSRMKSIYWWKGRVESADEVVLIAKTSAHRAPAALKRIRDLHPYECPCAVVIPIADGLPRFLAWIDRETKAERSSNPPRHARKGRRISGS